MALSSTSRDVVRLEHAQNVGRIGNQCRKEVDRLRQNSPRGGGTQKSIDDCYVEYAKQALDLLSDSYLRAYVQEDTDLTVQDVEQILAEMTQFINGLWESRANLEPRGIGLEFRENLDTVVPVQRQKLLLAMKRMRLDRRSRHGSQSYDRSLDSPPPQRSDVSEPSSPSASPTPTPVRQPAAISAEVKPPETVGAAMLSVLWRAHPIARNITLILVSLVAIMFALWTTFPDTTKERVINSFADNRKQSNTDKDRVSVAPQMFTVHGKVLPAKASHPATLMVGLLWGLEDDDHYYFAGTNIEPDGSFVIRITSQPPDKALMFFTHKDWGASTPALLGKLGVAYIIAFVDRNDSGVYEADVDTLAGASDRYVVTYLEGKLPDGALTMKAVEQGYSLSRAVKPTEHGIDTSFDSLVPANSDTRVTIRAQENPRNIVWPNWT